MPDALLSYTLSCTPNPLYVSTQQNKETGQLTLEVGQPFSVQGADEPIPADTGWDSGPAGTGGGVLNSSGGTSVWCRWFEIVIPIGDKATDLANIPDQSALQAISIYSPPGWTNSARLFQAPGGQWNAGVTFTSVDRYGAETPYLFNGTNPVNVTISNIPINAVPGFAAIPITEYSSQTSATTGYAERQTVRESPKAEKDFYFYDLHPTRPFVALNQAPILQWKGNVANTAFTVYWYDGNQYQEAAVAGQSWQCPPGHIPQNTTTFMVGATYVPPGQSRPVTVHLTTTVTVTNPVIHATSVTATADITTNATLRADTIGRATGPGNITVNDNVVLLSGLSAITASGNITARHITSNTDVAATGNVTAGGNMTANGNVSAAGNVTASRNVEASGSITANGDVTARTVLRGNTVGRVSGAGNITVNDGLTLLSGLTATSASGTISANRITSNTDVVANATLRGNNIGRVSGGGNIVVGDTLELRYSLTAVGSLTAAGDITARGKRLVGIGDEIALRNYSNNSGPFYLYCLSGGSWNGGASGSPYIVGNRSNSYSNSIWTIIRVGGTAADDDSADGPNEPDS